MKTQLTFFVVIKINKIYEDVHDHYRQGSLAVGNTQNTLMLSLFSVDCINASLAHRLETRSSCKTWFWVLTSFWFFASNSYPKHTFANFIFSKTFFRFFGKSKIGTKSKLRRGVKIKIIVDALTGHRQMGVVDRLSYNSPTVQTGVSLHLQCFQQRLFRWCNIREVNDELPQIILAKMGY